jgi:tetratricopeptide (TPR) repeat protein
LAERYAESAIASVEAMFRLQDALKNWKNAIPMQWSLSAYLDTLGWVHYLKGQDQLALPLIQTSYEIRRSGEVAAHLANVHARQGTVPEAKKYYREALDLRPGLPLDISPELKAILGTNDSKAEKYNSSAAAGGNPGPLETQGWCVFEPGIDPRFWPKDDPDAEVQTLFFVCLADETGQVQDLTFFNGTEPLQSTLRAGMSKIKFKLLTINGRPIKTFHPAKIAFLPGHKVEMQLAISDEAFFEVWMMALEAEGFKGY